MPKEIKFKIITPRDLDKVKKEVTELKETIKKLQRDVVKFQNPKCPNCESREVIKRGKRYNKTNKIVQKYQCQNCNYKFSQYDLLDYRMRNKREDIERALELRKQGKTLAQISNEIGGVTRQTIHRWLQKFQPPTEEKTAIVETKNQYGKYKREFKIKV